MRIKNIFQVSGILSVIFFCTVPAVISSLHAEQIILKDGRIIEGSILSRSSSEIQVRTPDGFITIPAAEVERITDRTSQQGTMGEVMKSFRKVPEHGQGSASSISQDEPVYSRTMAHLRSGVYPGFGQFYQDRNLSGTLFAVGFTVSLFNYGANVLKADAARAFYRDKSRNLRSQLFSYPTNPDNLALTLNLMQTADARLKYRQSIKTLNQSATLMGGIYLLNHLDVYIFHPGKNIFSGFYADADRLGLSLQVRF